MHEKSKTCFCELAGNSKPLRRTRGGKRMFEIKFAASAGRARHSSRQERLENTIAVPIWFQHFRPNERTEAIESVINMTRRNWNPKRRQLRQMLSKNVGIVPTLLQPSGNFEELTTPDRCLHLSHSPVCADRTMNGAR